MISLLFSENTNCNATKHWAVTLLENSVFIGVDNSRLNMNPLFLQSQYGEFVIGQESR